MDTRVAKLISAINRLREYSHTQEDLVAVKDALDLIFLPDARCLNFVYTVNTDKLPFGCVVIPSISSDSLNNFMITGECPKIESYEVELDSKTFDYGLTDEEVAAILLYNIYHMIGSSAPLNNVRELIDMYFTMNGNCLVMRDSIQYQAILAFGLVDALNQLTSCLNLPDDVVSDPFLESLGVEEFKSGISKLYKEIPGCDNEVLRQPNLSMLNWALRLYCDVAKERPAALKLLDKCKDITASTLYINKMNAVINALNRIDTSIVTEGAVNEYLTEAKKKGGLLAQLKYNGLRDIESDLYEFMLRAKNAETEEDVYYALKQINARLAILDDYIRENPDDEDLDRWIALKMKYMDVRDELAKKKLTRHNYGLFIDYNALDKLDDED